VVTLEFTPGSWQQALLHPLGDLLVGRERGAFGNQTVHQDLGPAGIREELLLHLAHAHDAQGEGPMPSAPMVIQRCCTHQFTSAPEAV
jgi:hypothetical protein